MPYFLAISDDSYPLTSSVWGKQVGIHSVLSVTTWIRGGTAITPQDDPLLVDAKILMSSDLDESFMSPDVAEHFGIMTEGRHKFFLFQEHPETGDRYVNFVETYVRFYVKTEADAIFWICKNDIEKRFSFYETKVPGINLLIAKYKCKDFSEFVGDDALINAL